MTKENTTKFIEALHEGVVPATGCTEPIAVAFGAATCMKYLPTKKIDSIKVNVSLNVMKNAIAVIVPGTGEPGLQIAAATGALIGDPELGLKVISKIQPSDMTAIRDLTHSGQVSVDLAKVEDDLYVDVEIVSGDDEVKTYIAGDHTNIFKITHNGEIIYSKPRPQPHAKSEIKTYLQTQKFIDIWNFAMEVPIEEISFMKKAADLNLALSEEGLKHDYGIGLGKSLMSAPKNNFGPQNSDNLDTKIVAYTVAASDARMGGAVMPAMSNSGSGNQGITATIPVCVVAQEMSANDEKLIRALTLSHLTAIYIHAFLPVLSAFCATDSAAMGAATGISYLMGQDATIAGKSIKNMAGDAAGMVCDGAGCSCAMKVATSVSSMYRAVNLALQGTVIPASNGLVCDDIDQTIKGIGRLGTDGMKETDPVVLNIMINK